MVKISRKRKIQQYYASRVFPNWEGYEILSWSSREAQYQRFQVLLNIMRSHFAEGICPTLLDIGCGLAELAAFLEKADFPVRYTGVDLTEEVLEEGRRRCSSLDLRLLDVFADPCPFPEQSFDVVFASGIFNMELGNNNAFAEFAIGRMASLARRLAVANFLHQRCFFQHPVCHYYDPDKLIAQLQARGVPFQLHENYLDNDFTLEFKRQ
jgi:ubiquinone/menaquinone biosynthesis C-methylase UbiE